YGGGPGLAVKKKKVVVGQGF
nr:3B [Potamipivirus A]